MHNKNSFSKSRRGFITTLAGATAGLAIMNPVFAGPGKKQIKDFVSRVELDLVVSSRPAVSPDLTMKHRGENLLVYKAGAKRPSMVLNGPGRLIFESCDGTKTPQHIGMITQTKYDIDSHKAHIDCIDFIFQLKNKGAVNI